MADNVDGRKASCECCKSTEKLKTCSKCKHVFYCSREHQLQDWKKHKRSCKTFQDQHEDSHDIKERLGTVGGGSMATNIKSAHAPNGKHVDSIPHKTNNADVESSNETAQANSRQAPQKITNTLDSASRSVKENLTSGPGPTVPQKEDHKQNRSQSSPSYDPRPFLQTDFPIPKSRDGDTIARHAADHLERSGFCVLDGFLNQEDSLDVLAEVKSIQDSGVLVDGLLSGGRTSSEKSKKFTKRTIRGDKITWLQGTEESCPRICAVIGRMDDLMQRLNYYLQGQYVIGGRTKAMVACYPGNGAGYACHVDNPNRDGRCVTCIYYLNNAWDVKTQGGLLRLLPVSGGHVDVEPLLNRLLLFWSDRRNPHEVQPAFDMRGRKTGGTGEKPLWHRREPTHNSAHLWFEPGIEPGPQWYAMTVWYFDKTEREEAKMAQLNEDMTKLGGEVSLSDVQEQKERKDQLEEEIQTKSSSAVAGLSSAELQALSAMLDGQPDPRAILTSLGVAPTIQDALLSQLKEIK